ncbi:Crp/Fnr family transcriptional regulator [Alphaproteobacteria bacterium]|nr:Crp/Fnr family transcriptional regulator [Alphaproteobacteria bacterium]
MQNAAYCKMECQDCDARHDAVCGVLGPDQLLSFAKLIDQYRYNPQQEILAQEESYNFFGTIQKGMVKLTRLLPDGREQVVGLQFPGDVIGRIGDHPMHFSAVAVTEVDVCAMTEQSVLKAMNDFPAVKDSLLDKTFKALEASQQWLVVVGQLHAEERVVAFIQYLCERAGKVSDDESVSFTLTLTRQEIAEMLGLKLETVSRHFSKLRKMGLLSFEINNRYRVSDLGALSERSGEVSGVWSDL